MTTTSVPITHVIDRSLQFNNIDELIDFAKVGIDQLDLDTYIRSLDHAVFYLERVKANDLLIRDLERFIIEDNVTIKVRLGFIINDVQRLSNSLPEDERYRLNGAVQPIIRILKERLK